MRTASLGDVISVEPVVRALKRSGYRNVYVDAGSYAPVFENNPFVSPVQDVPCGVKTVSLMNTYENELHLLREHVYLRKAGVELPNEELLPRIYLSDDERAYGKRQLCGGDWIIIDPGYPMQLDGRYLRGRLNGEDKIWQRAFWSEAEWGRLIQKLKSNGFMIVQIGNMNGVGTLPDVDLDLSGRTGIRQLFSIISAASFFVGMESGPMHVAQALGVPGVAIFHPNNPESGLKPFGSKIHAVYRNSGDLMNEDELFEKFNRLMVS